MVFFLLLALTVFSDDCLHQDWKSEQLMAIQFETGLLQPTETCIKEAISQKYFELSISIAKKAIEQGIPISETLIEEIKNLKSHLDKLTDLISSQTPIKMISPAFQWAQSPNKVFIDIKFSHRLESPGCVDIKEPLVKIEPNNLEFSGFCTRSNQRLKIVFDLELFDEIDPENSFHSFSETGRLQMQLEKVEEKAWGKVYKGNKPKGMHVWWEIKEKYEEQMKKFEDEEDEVIKSHSGLEHLVNNPNVVIKDSYVDGKRIDNTDL